MSRGINLLPDKDKTGISSLLNRLRLLRFIAVGLLFGVSAASMILYFLIVFSPLPQLKEKEKESIAAFSQVHSEVVKIALVKERSQSISALIKNRKSFDKTLALLQSKLPPDGEITGLSMSKNILSFTFVSKSLAEIETVLTNLLQASEAKQFSQITMSNLSLDTEKNIFQVTVNIVLL